MVALQRKGGMFPDFTFLKYLIEWGFIEDALETWESISDHEEEIRYIEESLASGAMKSSQGDYTWKDLRRSDNTPRYASKAHLMKNGRKSLHGGRSIRKF